MLALLLIGLLFKDQELYSLILFSLSAAPLLNQVVKSKQYNTGIFFILVIKLFLNSVIVVKIFSLFFQQSVRVSQNRILESIISCTIYMTFFTLTLICLAKFRYVSSQIQRKQVLIEVVGIFLFILFYALMYHIIDSHRLVFGSKVII